MGKDKSKERARRRLRNIKKKVYTSVRGHRGSRDTYKKQTKNPKKRLIEECGRSRVRGNYRCERTAKGGRGGSD